MHGTAPDAGTVVVSGDTHLGLLAEMPGGRGVEVSPPSLTRGNFDEMFGGGPGPARRLAALGAPVVAALFRFVNGHWVHTEWSKTGKIGKF